MTGIIDYGVGNLFSLAASLKKLGIAAEVQKNPGELYKYERIILPGVGAFPDAADKLSAAGMDTALKAEAEKGKPILGICLGMQLLFDKSLEFYEKPGLGLIPGTVVPIETDLKIPQIGWNSLEFCGRSPIFKYLKDGEYVYFVHSYHAVGCDRYITAVTDYGARVTAAVQNKNVYGTQFHPEKSGDCGLKILKAFSEL
jgi:imidazole glycerol phosphate synthase, glutamine amidotransferase subunit